MTAKSLLASIGAVLVVAVGVCGCSTDDSAAPGDDAHNGTGGVTGGMGGAGSGGATSNAGGSAESGGSAGMPHAAGRGGTAGAGGAMSSAGTSSAGAGAGGQSGAGGTAGSDGGGGGGSANAGAGPGGGAAGDGGSGSAGAAGGGGSGGGGAGNAGTGGGAAGGTASYNPCPTNGDPCKILPFGDSITRGHGSADDAGYRSRLFELIVAANQKATFTGSLTNGPTQVAGRSFPRAHEGRPGWTIDPGYNMISSSYGGISSLVPSPALNGDPHIILLMIGTNDLFARDTANMSTRLEVLVDKIIQNAPDALIVLAQITPLSTSNSALTTYNGRIPGIIQSRAAMGRHIIGVDMSKMPIATDLDDDGTHPNARGYAYIAGVWYGAIKDLLPK